MRHWLTFIIAGFCLALATTALALGIGEPRQFSALNRPLHVVLPLTDGAGLSPEDVSVSVADAAAYRRAGLTRGTLSDALSATVERQADGLVVVLDSPHRVREPFADLLLVVTWPGGQWQRQVSLLFDPVDYAGAQPLLDGDRDAAARTALPVDPVRAESMPASAAPRPWPEQLTVHRGDSLSSLVASLLPRAGVNRHALMQALYRANPAAFADGDIDRLRAGSQLDVPTLQAVLAMPEGETPGQSSELSATDTSDGQASDSEASPPTVSEAMTPAVSTLPLISSLRQKVARLTIDIERQQASIVTLQAERDRLRAALDTAAAGGGASAKPVTDPSGSVDAAVPPDTPGTSSTPSRQAPSTPTASLWERLLDHVGWIGGGALIVLLLSWGWQRRRARWVARASASENGETSVAADEQAVGAAKPALQPAAQRRTAAMAVEVDSASISQADIYIAYGRLAEARDWLRQRLAEGEDASLRLGLIRVLGELRDMEALEAAFAALGGDASPEQRREAQRMIDDYRAQSVEESWQEAMADNEREGASPSAAQADDIDALFEAEPDNDQTMDQEPVLRWNESSERDTGADEARFEEGHGTPEPDGFESAPQAISIEYEPPLERESPEIEERPTESDTMEFAPMPDIDFRALPLDTSPASMTMPEDGGANAEAESDRPAGSVSESSEADAEILMGWDIEEVEFRPSHRDNGRP